MTVSSGRWRRGWLLLGILLCSSAGAVDLEPSFFELDLQQIRFASAFQEPESVESPATTPSVDENDFDAVTVGHKSPFKAFLLSAALPGAGQLYCGSRLKPLFFVGAEIAAWGLHLKWHGDGEEATDTFEDYNRTHWSREAYEQKYLLWAYGVTDDDSTHAPGVTHNLPDTETQQYFEMTGKYNQFAWGWDDAVRDGHTLDYYELHPEELPITGDATTPYSAHRFIYEEMRHDANQKYEKARRMIIVSIINHLASAFEAYFSAKHHNESATDNSPGFTRLSMRASLKSYHTKRDTPFVKLSYRF